MRYELHIKGRALISRHTLVSRIKDLLTLGELFRVDTSDSQHDTSAAADAGKMHSLVRLKRFVAPIVSMIAAPILLAFVPTANAGWQPIRTSSNASGWQKVVCDNANAGWRSCEMGLTVVLTAAPAALAATGETTTITATVTDYYGGNVGSGTTLNWSTTDGALGAPQSATDVNGQAFVTLRSSSTIGGASVTGATSEGSGSLYVPFTDKWLAIGPTYTAWANTGAPYSCTGWSPAASTVAQGSFFTQYQNCNQNQIAYQQNRQQSAVTGQIVNVGGPIPLYQTIVITQSQGAVGTLPPPPPPPPAAPVCTVIQGSTINAPIVGWTQNNNDGTWTLYDQGATGIVTKGSAAKYDRWGGSVQYNGYTYTVGQFVVFGTFGRNQERSVWQICKAPL